MFSGPPCPPIDPIVEDSKETTAVISWIRCFHGGFAQTFVAQYSTDKNNWINATSVEGGLSRSKDRLNASVENLKPDTTYSIRLFSYNEKGKSRYTAFTDVTTKPEGMFSMCNMGSGTLSQMN